jgi:hypothetical protein
MDPSNSNGRRVAGQAGDPKMMGEGESKDANVQGILDFNALQYEAYPDLSVAVKRNQQDSPFQQSTFNSADSGSTLTCTLNTGSNFVVGRNSYMTFEAKFGNSGLWNQNCESGWNFIRALRITDKAGNELENIQNVNRLMPYVRAATSDQVSTWGTLETTSPLSATYAGFILPLFRVSGLFSTFQLLPPQLVSGLRVEVTFETDMSLIAAPVHAITEYSIRNLHIVTDSVQVTDSIQRKLNLQSANEGLEIQFRTWFSEEFSTSAGDRELMFESSKAVSKAFKALLMKTTSPALRLPQNVPLSYDRVQDLSRYQWVAGNLYFPQTLRITKDFPGGNLLAKQIFFDALRSEAKMESANVTTDLTVFDYTEPASSTLLTVANKGGRGAIAVSLERSTVQDISGMPLNSSRVLQFRGQLESPAENPHTWYMYLQYEKVARVFMDNLELEE